MEAVTALAVIVGVMAVVFVLAPLFRSEDKVKPLHKPRPGTRNLSGPHEEPQERPSTPTDGVRCPNCGTIVDDDFKYCSQCVTAVQRV